MALSGNIYHEISKILGVSDFFIGYWKKQFKTQGIAGIKLGHKGYLTSLQKTEVIEWLKNKEYCNLDEGVTYLEREFGVTYKSKQSYYELFNREKSVGKKLKKPILNLIKNW